MTAVQWETGFRVTPVDSVPAEASMPCPFVFDCPACAVFGVCGSLFGVTALGVLPAR
jgi:hypothetical protein